MRLVEREFANLDAVQGFIEGINFVNDDDIAVREVLVEVNVMGRDPRVRFVAIILDNDGDDSESDLVDDENGEWVRLHPGCSTEVCMKR
jgi:hypothetical protein